MKSPRYHDPEPPQHRDHRARRPRQDHARGQAAAPVGHARCPQARHRARDGLERARARARHHDPREEHRDPVARLPHQHRGHARPRGLRRRSGARAVDGGLRAAARGRRGRPDAADALRHAEGLRARPRADRRRQQGRPARGAAGMGREPDLRPVRPPRRQRAPARFPGRLHLGAAGRRGPCAGHDGRGHDGAVRDDHRALPGAGRGRRRPAAAAGEPARLLELRRLDRHRPHPPRHDPPRHAGRRDRPRRRRAQRAHRPGVRLHGPRARRGRGSAGRRHHRVLGPRGAEDLRHDLRPGRRSRRCPRSSSTNRRSA